MEKIFFTYEQLNHYNTNIYSEQYNTSIDIYYNSIIKRLEDNGIIKIIPKIWLEYYKKTLPNKNSLEQEYVFSWRELSCIEYDETILNYIDIYNIIDKALWMFNTNEITIWEVLQFIESNTTLELNWNTVNYNYFNWTEDNFTLLIE